jgi:energy-converting hydrogenase B subunit Q
MTEAASPPGPPPPETIGLMVETAPGPGVLHELTGVMARHRADITLVEILESGPVSSRIYFETTVPSSAEALEKDLAALPIARRVTVVKTFQRIYGKRIIIVGGGAQVGQVALGAISEADRHNIRGEHISVDTIPLVGEQTLADAVQWHAAHARVLDWPGPSWAATSRRPCADAPGPARPRASTWRAACRAADLVVTDPVRAG